MPPPAATGVPPLEQLRRLFDAGHVLSYADLTHRLGVTERHARRLLDQLRAEGLPLCDRRDGLTKRFFLSDERQRSEVTPPRFDQEELMALAVAARASGAALGETPHGPPLRRAFDKLLERVAPHSYLFEVDVFQALWHFDEQAPGEVDPEVFLALERAIQDHRSVRIDYFVASRAEDALDRKIDPLLLARRGRAWMVVAYCHLREALRDFVLERIEVLRPCDPAVEEAYFDPPVDFDAELYFRDRFHAVSGEAYHEVRLLVEPDRAAYFRRRKYHPTQQIEEQADGRVIVSFEVEGLEEARSFCQSWGTGVTVVGPPELVARMQEEAQVLALRYSKPAGGV